MASITLDWNEYLKKATEVVEEGCVLLENKNQCLPFEKDTKVAIFGRIQKHYYKSGTGSGGMVNVSKVVDIVEGLKNTKHIKIDSELETLYEEWEKENPFELGLGWGNDPTCQKEMPVTLEQAKYYANKNQVALIILGRTAGEDMDNTAQEGSWFLTNLERQLLENVRKAFAKVVVVLNNSNIIDINFVQEYNIDSVLIGWQGGIIGGQGVANVLTGLETPSGKLSDTIAKSIEDYPAHTNFGNPEAETYQEDIYVGYRYFETFAKDKVLYPFGYGLSYTNFEITKKAFNYDFPNITLEVEVKNTGNFSGKEVVQIYLGLPEGKLGKPAKTLCGFQKTKLLAPNETQTLSIKIDIKDFASYDDLGLTGKSDVSVLEEGKYQVFVGNSVKDSKVFGEFNV
ncbi:MAG: glycoside hydrolase family 3 C-terminal domain-containing protein, partial [Treponemataceae bacterium]|nr:glycoside hydrolase family 3 C-terminal domain-containing protein [Treponemataceae bacterium]